MIEDRLRWSNLLRKLLENRKLIQELWASQTSGLLNRRPLFDNAEKEENNRDLDPRQLSIVNDELLGNEKPVVVRTINELYNAASLAKIYFDENLLNLSKKSKFFIKTSSTEQGWDWYNNRDSNEEYTPHLILMPLKSRARINEKSNAMYKYNELGPPFAWVYDVVRASFVVGSETQVIYTVDLIKSCPNFKVLNIKNRFKNPAYTGYRDVIIQVQFNYIVDDHILPKDTTSTSPTDTNQKIIDDNNNIQHHIGMDAADWLKDVQVNKSYSFICEIQIHHIEVLKYSRTLQAEATYTLFRDYFTDSMTDDTILPSSTPTSTTPDSTSVKSGSKGGSLAGKEIPILTTMASSRLLVLPTVSKASRQHQKSSQAIRLSILHKLELFTRVPVDLNSYIKNLSQRPRLDDLLSWQCYVTFFRVTRERELLELSLRTCIRLLKRRLQQLSTPTTRHTSIIPEEQQQQQQSHQLDSEGAQAALGMDGGEDEVPPLPLTIIPTFQRQISSQKLVFPGLSTPSTKGISKQQSVEGAAGTSTPLSGRMFLGTARRLSSGETTPLSSGRRLVNSSGINRLPSGGDNTNTPLSSRLLAFNKQPSGESTPFSSRRPPGTGVGMGMGMGTGLISRHNSQESSHSQFSESAMAGGGTDISYLDIDDSSYLDNEDNNIDDDNNFYIITLAHSLSELAVCLKSKQLFIPALEIMEDAIYIYEQAVITADTNYQQSLLFVMNILCALGEFERALPIAQIVYQVRSDELGNKHPDTLIALKAFADIVFELRDWFTAKVSYIDLYEGWTLLENICVPATDALFNVARTLEHLEELDDALETYLQVLQLKIKIFGQHSLEVAGVHYMIGEVLDALGRFSESLVHLEIGLNIKKESLGRFHVDVVDMMSAVAGLMDETDRPEEAMKLYLEGLDIINQLETEHNNKKGRGKEKGAIGEEGGNSDRRRDQEKVNNNKGNEGDRNRSNNTENHRNNNNNNENAIEPEEDSYEFAMKELKAELLNDYGSVLLNVRKPNEAANQFEMSFDIRERLHGPTHPVTLQSLAGIWKSLEHEAYDYSLGFSFARKRLTHRAKEACRVGAMSRHARAMEITLKSNEIREKGDFEEAKRLLDEIARILGGLYYTSHPAIAALHSNMALLHEDQHEFDLALNEYDQAIEISQKSLGEKHNMVLKIRNNRGQILYQIGRLDEAIVEFEECLEIRLLKCQDELKEKKARDGNKYSSKPSTATNKTNSNNNNNNNMEEFTTDEIVHIRHHSMAHKMHSMTSSVEGTISESEGNNLDKIGEEGDEEEVLEFSLIDVIDPDVATLLYNLGLCYRAQKKYGEAQECLEKAVLLTHRLLGDDHPDYAATLNTLGVTLIEAKEFEHALQPLQRSLHARQNIFDRKHPFVTPVLNNLGVLHQLLTDNETAGIHLEQSLDIRIRLIGPFSPETKTALHNLAVLYDSQQDYEIATELRQQMASISDDNNLKPEDWDGGSESLGSSSIISATALSFQPFIPPHL